MCSSGQKYGSRYRCANCGRGFSKVKRSKESPNLCESCYDSLTD